MKTAIQQCAQDLFETDLSHEVKTKIVDILHTHLTTEKKQIIEAATHGANFDKSPFKNAQDYYDSTFG